MLWIFLLNKHCSCKNKHCVEGQTLQFFRNINIAMFCIYLFWRYYESTKQLCQTCYIKYFIHFQFITSFFIVSNFPLLPHKTQIFFFPEGREQFSQPKYIFICLYTIYKIEIFSAVRSAKFASLPFMFLFLMTGKGGVGVREYDFLRW